MRTYFPHTLENITDMLNTIGVDTIEDLFDDIPEGIRHYEDLNLPKSLSEYEIINHLNQLAKKNRSDLISFLGAGAYDHIIPEIVGYLISRSEFMTAYTPYQPEASQGTLQAIFEYQTMICDLTGMEVANASHYDGATAAAEAIFMITAQTRKNKVLVSDNIHPQINEVIHTYCVYKGIEILPLNNLDGLTDYDDFLSKLDGSVAGVYIQSPNFYGIIENVEPFANAIHEQKGLLVMGTNPMACAVLKTPYEVGADIAVGDSQPLGNPLNYGGPYAGFMATTDKLARKLPGRIVGQTKDLDGKTGYVLTLQAREQHIRREKATSNITSNQALNALAATIYMAVLGKEGLIKVAKQSMAKARYLEKLLTNEGKYEKVYQQPTFIEFLITGENLTNKVAEGPDAGYLPGFYDAKANTLLVCTTEKRSEADIVQFANWMNG